MVRNTSHSPPPGNNYPALTEIFEQIKEIRMKVEQTHQLVTKLSSAEPLQGYISEDEAKTRFKRGTTWFWTKRQEGLDFIKVGATNYYRISDLLNFFGAEI